MSIASRLKQKKRGEGKQVRYIVVGSRETDGTRHGQDINTNGMENHRYDVAIWEEISSLLGGRELISTRAVSFIDENTRSERYHYPEAMP